QPSEDHETESNDGALQKSRLVHQLNNLTLAHFDASTLSRFPLQMALFAPIGKPMQIPLVDLKAQYATIKNEVDQAISQVLADTAFIAGKYAKIFEQEFASYAGLQHCIGCGNGTDALELALAALGIGPGDEVLVPALTWVSSAFCVSQLGAKPVFVDIL